LRQGDRRTEMVRVTRESIDRLENLSVDLIWGTPTSSLTRARASL
jgi:hypothetical protein